VRFAATVRPQPGAGDAHGAMRARYVDALHRLHPEARD
jgi:hypothetical protein